MKLLVIKLHALGDLVIHTPAFELLRDGIPEAEITLLTTDWASPAAIGLPFFNHVITVPNSLFFADKLKALVGLSRLLLKLRKELFDVVVSFHKSGLLNRYFRFVGRSDRFFSYSDHDSSTTIKLDETRHSAPNAVDLTRLVIEKVAERNSTFDQDELRYRWAVSADEISASKSIIDSLGIVNNRIAMIFPGGGSNPSSEAPEKRWKAEGFARVAEWLKSSEGLDTILSGSRSDLHVCEEVANLAKVTTFNICGKTEIRLTAAIMAQSCIVLSNDSAPLHISAAVGAPTVGIFGPTGAKHKLPPGDHSVSVSLGLPCSPCYYGTFKGCIFENIRCMDELSHQQVIEAMKSLLNKLPAQR